MIGVKYGIIILKSYKKLSGRGKGIAISFDRDMLNTTVKYGDGELTFSEIPDSLRAAIEEELEDDLGQDN